MAATDTDGRTAEEPKAQDAAQNPSPAADGEGLKDKHGQDAISAGK